MKFNPHNLAKSMNQLVGVFLLFCAPQLALAQGSGHTGGGGGVQCLLSSGQFSLEVLESWEIRQGQVTISDFGRTQLEKLSQVQDEQLVLEALLAGLSDAPLFKAEVARRAQEIGPVQKWPKMQMENAFQFHRLAKLPENCKEVVLAGWFDGELYQNSLYTLNSPAQRAILWFHEAVTSFLVERGIQDPVLVRGLFKAALEWNALAKDRPALLSGARFLSAEERVVSYSRARQAITQLLLIQDKWNHNESLRNEMLSRIHPSALIPTESAEKWAIMNELQPLYLETVLPSQKQNSAQSETQWNAAVSYSEKALLVLQRVLGMKTL